MQGWCRLSGLHTKNEHGRGQNSDDAPRREAHASIRRLCLLAGNNDDDAVRDAVAEASNKRARLQTFIDAAADGSITAAALGRIETKLMTDIDAAETRARRASTGHVLDQAAGIDRTQWNLLPITTRREIITAMCHVIIQAAGRGHRTFDPTLIQIRPRTD